jgi:hypothetical protein
MNKPIGVGDVAYSGMVAIRWFSVMNPELDCVCFVPQEYKNDARIAIKKGVEDFWGSNYLTYGDCIESELIQADIPYIILYPEIIEDWLGQEECAPEWDEWADKLDAITISRVEVVI